VISFEKAKQIVHGHPLTSRDHLLVALAIDSTGPVVADQIRSRCVRLGLRKLAKRNISDVLGKANAYVARTSDGWELQESGKSRVAELAGTEEMRPTVHELDGALLAICERFHRAVVPLIERRNGKPIIDFGDEYDVQDVFGVILRSSYDDVRAEEWTPSHGGKAARIDFVIADIGTATELKRARPRQQIADELTIDIARYAKRTDVDKLLCFVYDPESVLRKHARQIEKDLSGRRTHGGRSLDVTVLVRPK